MYSSDDHLVPRKVMEKVANRAVELIRMYGRSMGWKSTESIKAYARRGVFGIKLNGKYWLRYQNNGISPFVMYSLEGKVVPASFGFRTVKGAGLPGFVTIDGDKVWRDSKWTHPGLKPKYFIEKACCEAYKMYANEINKYKPLDKFRRL